MLILKPVPLTCDDCDGLENVTYGVCLLGSSFGAGPVSQKQTPKPARQGRADEMGSCVRQSAVSWHVNAECGTLDNDRHS